jgi:DNA-binding response OmpR family regulator
VRAEGKVPGEAGDSPPARVLVIEDHTPTRNTLKGLLTRRRFDVATAASVAEAIAQVQRRKPDFVISDLGLPDGDGCEMWRRLRRDQPDLVGIALSGYGMEEDVARTKDAGFAEHLTKPVNIHALDRAIAALIRRARREREVVNRDGGTVTAADGDGP